MKFNITLLTIITLSTCTPLCADDDKPQPSHFERARARLQAARGKTAPDVPRSEAKETPTMQELVKSANVDDEAEFNRKLRAHLAGNPGCETWNTGCEGACPTWDKEVSVGSDLSTVSGFDQPIRCKDYLEPCYQTLRGCSQDDLDTQLKKTIGIAHPRRFYGQTRCKAVALICQGANPNAAKFSTETPLHLAAYIGDHHFSDFLLQHDADANALIGDGYSPLMLLAAECMLLGVTSITNTADSLLHAGAEMHHRIRPNGRYPGKTALEIAKKNEQDYNSAPCRALADFLQDYEKQPNRVQE